MTLSKPNYFPKAPSPNAITLQTRVSTFEFVEDTIQFIAESVTDPPHTNKIGKITGAKVWMHLCLVKLL